MPSFTLLTPCPLSPPSIAFKPYFTMTVATSSDSTHSVSCLSRGLALLGLSPTSKRAPLSEKNLNLHNGSDASSGSGSETSSTESWFTVEKPEKTAKIDGVEKHPASDSASQLVVETYEEDLPEYTEKSAIAVAVRYKNRELFFIVKPTTRIKTIKVSYRMTAH